MTSNKLPDPFCIDKNSSVNVSNTAIYASSTAAYHYPKHQTPYLLLANFRNTGNYQLNDRPISINDHYFYFLNAGDQLEITFQKNMALDTMIVLFDKQFISEVINYRGKTTEDLLSNGTAGNAKAFQIPAIPFMYNETIRRNIDKIRKGEFTENTDWENIYFELIGEFLAISDKLLSDLSKLHVKKKSTREELYRRIMEAWIYMQDNCCSRLTLEEIASAACLNKFHFLTLFKKYYGRTPHQHLINLKMEKAHELLRSGKFAAGEVCYMVGFESQGSFSNLFKKHYGFPPSQAIGLPSFYYSGRRI